MIYAERKELKFHEITMTILSFEQGECKTILHGRPKEGNKCTTVSY